jgi:23S rRNA pseudouridine1911/1915/1917 synthase
MAAIGHPVLGDPVYGRMTAARSAVFAGRNREAGPGFRRQALHAYLLGFEHPGSHARARWEAEIPGDMKQLIQVLEGN